MIPYYGDFAEDDTVNLPFNTFDSNDPAASVTITNLADSDIHVHKDGSEVQATTDGATVNIDHDGITGNHMITIDTSADAYYATGSEYSVRIEGTTVDGATINAWVGSFSIERAGGALAVIKLIQTAVIANAAGADVAADIIALKAVADAIPTTAMRGTDSAATAAVLGAAVGASISADIAANKTGIDAIPTTAMRGTDSAALASGVNVTQISGDATAADNLEAMYDGSGYIDDAGPASRAQVAAISTVGGGAVNFAADTDNVLGAIKSISFVGVQTTNTFANTKTLDSVFHVIDDTTNAIDIVYGFSVGGGRLANQMSFDGFLNSNNDVLNILAYDFVAVGWDTIGTITGQNGSANVSLTQPLLVQHTGTGADVGKVYIRLQNTGQSNPTLNVDRLDVSAVSNLAAIGYEGGAVWLDTNAANTNTEPRVDGTASNPVSTIAAARTLLTSLNTKIIHCVPGTSFTLASDTSGIEFTGAGYTVALGGQDVNGARFFNAAISGTGVGAGRAVFTSCILVGATSLNNATFLGCNFNGQTVTLTATGTYHFERSFGAAVVNYGAAVGNTTVNMAHFAGDLTVEAMGDTGTDVLNLQGHGSFTEGTCAGGAATIAGVFSKAGITNITVTEVARLDASIQIDWTDGGRLDLLIDAAQVSLDNLNLGIIYGIAETGTLSTTQATTDLTGFANDELIGRVIIFTGGTADGQASRITDYASASGLLTFDAITTTPANLDTFKLV